MSERDPILAATAREMARAFDQTFAAARAAGPAPQRDFLTIRVGGDPHAIALGDIAELFPRGRLTPLPYAGHECLGLAGLRGTVTPVYDLRVLLGYPPGTGAARWLARIVGAPAALAFDVVVGHLRAPSEALARLGDTDSAQRHVREILRTDGVVRPVIDMPSIVETIGRLARDGVSPGG
jgi:chemotaxis signal transduction protein